MEKSQTRLLVIDFTAYSEILKDYLIAKGFSQTQRAGSCEEALTVARNYRPHAVLMTTMSNMTRNSMKGYEGCREFRKLYGDKIFILGLSEIMTREKEQLWKEAGANNLFNKSKGLEEISSAIEKELENMKS